MWEKEKMFSTHFKKGFLFLNYIYFVICKSFQISSSLKICCMVKGSAEKMPNQIAESSLIFDLHYFVAQSFA